MRHRVVFMGTPGFACPALDRLANAEEIDVSLVVTQPDRPAGRGRKIAAPPVKDLATRLDLPIYQASSLRTAEQRQPIVDAAPDLIVVAAFGLILGKSILELPEHGCLNLHASLLPKYRGASPISAAILNGDPEAGVTLMGMERGLDTGPMYASMAIDIRETSTTESLTTELAALAGLLLTDNLAPLLRGELQGVPQPEGASLTRPLVKADGWIDWTRPAREIERLVRAMWSWPRAWTTLPDGTSFQVHAAHVADSGDISEPGTIGIGHEGMRVHCGDGWLVVDRGLPAGGKPLTGAQLAGKPDLSSGTVLGSATAPEVPRPIIIPVSAN